MLNSFEEQHKSKKIIFMNFQAFLDKYDFPGSVILLEGKRDVLEEDKHKLILFGELVVKYTRYMRFRSGNASGADELFCKKIVEHQADRLELITPYSTHRKKIYDSDSITKFSIDNVDFAKDTGLIYGSKLGNMNDKLIDSYVAGKPNRNTIKAAYLIRDTAKVLGTSEIKQANFAIFYDDLKNPKSGGTGHTMKVCDENGLVYIDQTIWFDWLNTVPEIKLKGIHKRWQEDSLLGGERLTLLSKTEDKPEDKSE